MKNISRLVPKFYTVHTGPSGIESAYQSLKMKENNFDCELITNEYISKPMREKNSGNEDDKNNNCERNVIVNNKSLDKNATQANKTTKMRANKKEHLRPIKRAQKMILTSKIQHYYSGLGIIPLSHL